MNYQIITQNNDCPQTHINKKTIKDFLKLKGINIVDNSNNKIIISCLLHDVPFNSLLFELTKNQFNNIIVYGCIDDAFKNNWQYKVKNIINENNIPFNISSECSYPIFNMAIAIKINTGCHGKCSFCRLGNRENVSFFEKDIIKEIKKYSFEYPFILFSNDCSAYNQDLITLINKILITYPEIKLAINSCSQYYFLKHKNEFYNLLTSGKLIGIGLSIQSGCNETLKSMNRNSIDKCLGKTLLNIKKNLPKDSYIYSEFIFGYPNETIENLYESLNFALNFTHIMWYRYFAVNNTKTYNSYPKILIGKDYSNIIEKFGIQNNYNTKIIKAHESISNFPGAIKKYKWIIKK